MDQNKSSQDQQSQDQQDQDRSQDQTIGRGREGVRNSGGISNRDMDEQQEQADLPERGESRQSER